MIRHANRSCGAFSAVAHAGGACGGAAAIWLMLATGGAFAQSSKLGGVWERIGASEQPGQPSIIELGAQTISVDQVPCRIEHSRAIHQHRWYVDAWCDQGDLLQLDLVLLADGRLLVARRILGAADIYTRRDRRTTTERSP